MQKTEKERAKKDIEMLSKLVEYFEKSGLAEKYKSSFEWAKNYLADAKHYYEKKDYFSSFGCANYGYGILDGILINEGIKERVLKELGL
ncbi:MAG: DUF357 domain-containing protein [Candidatus Anstonellales archaeon]